MSYDAWKVGYKSLWESMVVGKVNEAAKQARHIISVRGNYDAVETKTGVPWFVIGICHVREAGDPPDFKAVLHNGERIVGTSKQTRLVPKGRGPFRSWLEAAVDAVNIEHLNGVNWKDGWGPEHVAYFLEVFNGTGYRSHGIPSPYLWGGTSVQQRGKFVQDGVYDQHVMDPQVGGMAILRELMLLDPSVSFSPTPGAVFPTPPPQSLPVPAPRVPDPLPPPSTSLPSPPEQPPKAQKRKSGIWATLSLGVASTLAYLHTHWIALTLAALAVAAVGYGLWWLYKNRVPRNLSPKAIGPTGNVVELDTTTGVAPAETPATPTPSAPREDKLLVASEGTPPIA